MKLSEDKTVIDALKRILEDYDYLEYDETRSENWDFLRVKVTKYVDRDFEVITRQIVKKLEQCTGRDLLMPANVGNEIEERVPRNPDKDWTGFNIHERKQRQQR